MAKKKKGTSWFTSVKRVLWSPSKDSDKKIHQKEESNKKKEKKGWIFRKTKLETTNHVAEAEEEQKLVVTADEAVAEIIRVRATRGLIRRHWAAIIIQTAFRGYLARKALRALKGIVKLQALVRGNNVRNQAKLTLRCIKALVRVQDHVLNHHHHQRSRVLSSSPSYHNLEARRNSMFAQSNGFWDAKTYVQDIRTTRRSLSRDMSRCTNDFVVNHEETQSILQKKLENAIKREKAQALNQIRRVSHRTDNEPVEVSEETELLERSSRWMATKKWDNTITQSPINTRTHTHTLERSYPATPPSCRSLGLRSASPRVQPNYMTATESAKAKARTQSTPRRRPTTTKKRLCYLEEESCVWGDDHDSDYSSCYAAGKISPCSTTHLRWLK